jgi:hypothetical protein
MINPLRVWARYNLAVGYFATAVVIVVFIWLFAHLLLRAPEFYPPWDQRNFYNLAKEALSKVQSIIAGEPNSWSLAGWGFAHQYNVLFGLPLAPVFMALGDSWYVYGMAVALIYGTAATLTVGAIAVVLLAGYRPSIVFLTFAATAFVAITRSAGWYSTIFYYPDIGDAFIFSLWFICALLLLRRPTWLHTCELVVLTVAVILFRRYLLFVWGAVGVGLAISAAIEWWLYRAKGDPRENRILLRRIGHLAVSAIIALCMLAIPPRSFIREMLSIAFKGAYANYELNPAVVVRLMLAAMGIIPIGLSVAGYIVGGIVFKRRRFEIVGLGLGAILTMASWVMVLRQNGAQYWIIPGVLFLPVGIGLGVGALAEKLRGFKLAAVLGSAFLLFLLSGGRLVDGAMSKNMDIYDFSSLHLLQGRVTKIATHRGMEGPFREIFARMGVAGPQPRTVLVLASSFTFNEAVVQSAAETLLGNKAKNYLFPWVPALDSRDRLPVPEIIDADYVLVGNPLQTHTDKGFNGLRAAQDMFLNHAAALDFESSGEPVSFPGFSVSVYRRVRESDERTALATVEALKAAVPRRGYIQPSWIEISRPRRGEPEVSNDAVVAHNRSAGNGWPARYLSYDKVRMGSAELRGEGETSCPQGALVTLRAIEPDGVERGAVDTALLARHASQRPFSVSIGTSIPGRHLELEISPPASGDVPCDVTLNSLQLLGVTVGGVTTK